MSDKKVGAALVVGGGIGGIQSALDLAAAGIKVYLLEKESCIGGMMSQLDKTFPTNDCAMCSMAPRLVEVGRNKDIELITLGEIDSVTGSAGNFNVKIKKQARYINEEKCTGCGECETKCPVRVASEYNMELDERKAIYRRYPQAIPSKFAIDKLGRSPCKTACPAGQNTQGYIALIREKKYKEAYNLILRDNPFPSVCGRVCRHYCEDECTRSKFDESVSIRNLKRFVADWAFDNKIKPEIYNKSIIHDKTVAIIGSGPAGLTAAHDLRQKGYKVTVFESLPVIGGMMRVGIPRFRLAPERLERDIKNILTEGIEVKTNCKVESIDKLFNEGFSAVFIAVGAHKDKKFNMPGASLKNVFSAINFLRSFALNEKIEIAEKVVILGGGNVAMDAGRTAIRLGAKEVSIICLESREKMPADIWEIESAEKDGIKIFPSHSLTKIISNDDKASKIRFNEIKFYGFDAFGKPQIDHIENKVRIFDVDMVIFAIGQVPEFPFVSEGIALDEKGVVKVDKNTLATSKAGVFAGGDAVSGTLFIVNAIAAGHKAASSIDRFLNGEELYQKEPEIEKVILSTEEIKKRIKHKEMMQHIFKINGEDKQLFKERITGYTEEQALREANRCINCAICSECLECVEACGPKAIMHDMPKESFVDINVGAIILASGAEIYNPINKKEYGYKRFNNVISNLQFERILSASGPFRGKVLRPSDNQTPRKIAFVQCVGSRDEENKYCSYICCMAAIKEAIIAKEHEKEIKCMIFYTDIRAFSKGFEDYYNRAKEIGIKFIRCRPSAIKDVPNTGDLIVKYQDDNNKIKEDIFNLVVLSTGLVPSHNIREITKKMNIKLEENGFFMTKSFNSAQSTCDGIYVVGIGSGPKDIPDTVIGGSAAASNVMEILNEKKGTLITPKVFPPEKKAGNDSPRVGVFVCHCGKNIGGVVDVPGVVEFVKTLPDVVYAEDNLYTCSTDTAVKIKEAIEKQNLNRVVVASCSPRTHEALFQDTLRESGLNAYLFEMANIRDQCSWPHMHEPLKATEKAKYLVKMAVAKARLLEELYPMIMKVNQNALVIGGGLAGMTAALKYAKYGIKTFLVERNSHLGGNLKKIYYNFDGSNPQEKLKELINAVENNSNITVFKEANVEDVSGSVGRFKSVIKSKDMKKEIEHGVIIVATGSDEYKPKNGEYLYSDKDVLTQTELEEKLTKNISFIKETDKTFVMIQCVGARDNEHPYCKRICCTHAVKNALKIKELNPHTKIFVLYRDVRTYGFYENYYLKARESGVIFIPYNEDNKPEVVKINNKFEVKLKDITLNDELAIDADNIILSTGPTPDIENNEKISQLIKISLSKDKFFLEKHVKLNPSEFATAGVYLCGLAHYSKNIEEAILSAEAAAMAGYRIISKDERELEPRISFIVDENCDGCAYCIDPCPNKAITLLEYKFKGSVKKIVQIESSMCAGCGSCMATCPKKGCYVKNFRPDQIMAQAEAANSKTLEPIIIAFLCNWCSYAGADLAGISRTQYPPNVRIIRVMCSGMVHPNFVIETLLKGADAVLMCGCHPGDCHYKEGNLKAQKRAEAIDLMLQDYGIEPERYRLEWISASEGERFAKIISDMVEKIKKIGTSPYKQN